MQIELNKHKPDILILSEHGLKYENLTHTNIDGYKLRTNFCRTNHMWGGIAMYTRNTLSTEIEDLTLYEPYEPAEIYFETIAIRIKTKNQNIILIGTYRSPNSNNEEQFLEKLGYLLDQYVSKNNKIIIIGDANFNILKPNEQTIKNLENTLTQQGCHIRHIPVTRQTPTSISSIDGCYTNIQDNILDVSAYNNTLSDHHFLLCTIHKKATHQKFLYKNSRNCSKQNLEELKKQLRLVDWTSVYTPVAAEDKYNNFLNILQLNIDQVMPKIPKKITVPKTKTFWDNQTNLLRAALQDAQDNYNLTGTDKDRTTYIEIKKLYDQNIRENRIKQTTDRIQQAGNKNREIWKIINSERVKKTDSQSNIHLLSNNKIIKDPYHVSNIFNKAFSQPNPPQGIQQNKPSDNKAGLEHIPPFTAFKPISLKELDALFKHLNSKNSSGFDDISGRIVTHCKEEIIRPVHHIINSSLIQATIPDKLKIAKIYPKFKKGSKQDPMNYRPISNLPTISKLLERAIYNQLINHFEKNQILSVNQHGFRRGLNTTTAIAKLVEEITKIWEGKKSATGLFLDLQKAFDTVNWDTLISKFKKYKVQEKALNLIRHYLTNRLQFVELEHKSNNTLVNIRSSLTKSNRGVPQGSILGPLFFIIYINSLPEQIGHELQYILFADDTTIIIPTERSANNNTLINETLDKATTYCNSIDLNINKNKTIHIQFTPNNRDRCEEDSKKLDIPSSNSTKFLGIIIDQNLNWEGHIQHLCKKLSIAQYVIKRIRTISNEDTALLAYHSLFHSHIKYGIAAWGSTNNKNIEKVLIIQKKTIRGIMRLHHLEHCKPSFIKLNILTVISQYILDTIILSKQSTPTIRSEYHSHNTRNRSNIDIPQHRLKKTSQAPIHIGSYFYNLLPKQLKTTTEINGFTKKLKKYLINRPYYNTTEFVAEHTFQHLHIH